MGISIKNLVPAVATHPGEILLDEIKAHNYNQTSFSKLIGIKKSQLNEIIKGKRKINADLAVLIESVLNIEAIFWLNLQNQYDVDVARINQKNQKKAASITAYKQYAAVVAEKYLKKQGYFVGEPEHDYKKVEQIYDVDSYTELTNVIESIPFNRFRKSTALPIEKKNVITWVKCCEYESKLIQAKPFEQENWQRLKPELIKVINKNTHLLQEVERLLSNYGIKFLVKEKAPKAPIDGYAFWCDNNPTIAMTTRHKRLDNFAFTLFHELGHVYLHLANDKSKNVIDLENNEATFKQSKEEKEADAFAMNNLIPKHQWEQFQLNNKFDDEIFLKWSEIIGIHPAILKGRYCHWKNKYGIKSTIKNKIG